MTTTVFVDINVWSEVAPDNIKTFPCGCLERAPPSDLTLGPGAGISRKQVAGLQQGLLTCDLTWTHLCTGKVPGHA